MSPPITLDTNGKAKIKEATKHAPWARIYYADAETNKWSYAGIKGSLVFALNTSNNTIHFWMVGPEGVKWNYQLHDGLVLYQDRSVPFFLSFQGTFGGDVRCGFNSGPGFNSYSFVINVISRNVGLVSSS